MIRKAKVRVSKYGYFVCIVGACVGLLFGLDIGVIAGALPAEKTPEFLIKNELKAYLFILNNKVL